LLVSVHEAGHYLAGRAAGIPAAEMRIRLLTFPQHVALRDGERWVPPFDLGPYLAVMRRNLRTAPRLYLYTAGGMLLETAFMLAVCVLALRWGQQWLALLVAGMSLGILLVYLAAMNVPMAIRRGHPWGDVSGLWWLAKTPTAVLVSWDADDPGGVGVGRVCLSGAWPPGISPPHTVGPVTGTSSRLRSAPTRILA
jgi:hypothetical protein